MLYLHDCAEAMKRARELHGYLTGQSEARRQRSMPSIPLPPIEAQMHNDPSLPATAHEVAWRNVRNDMSLEVNPDAYQRALKLLQEADDNMDLEEYCRNDVRCMILGATVAHEE